MSHRVATAATNAATVIPEWITGVNFFKARYVSTVGLDSASASQSIAMMRMPTGCRISDVALSVSVDHFSAGMGLIARVFDTLNGAARPYIASATIIANAVGGGGVVDSNVLRANRLAFMGQRITGSANLHAVFNAVNFADTAAASVTIDLAVHYLRDIERSST